MEEFTLSGGGSIYVNVHLVESVVMATSNMQGQPHSTITVSSGRAHTVMGEVGVISKRIAQAFTKAR